jgi:hypothetical protein
VGRFIVLDLRESLRAVKPAAQQTSPHPSCDENWDTIHTFTHNSLHAVSALQATRVYFSIALCKYAIFVS